MTDKVIWNDASTTPVFSSYDVVLMPPPEIPEPSLPLLFAPGNYVGNQRFLVLLNIYRERFNLADMLNDDAERRNVAVEVMNTVAFSCTPNGRFFEQTTPFLWRQMEYGPEVMKVILSALKTPPVIPANHNFSPVCRYAPVARKHSSKKTDRQSEQIIQVPTDDSDFKRARRTSGFSMLCSSAPNTDDMVVSPDPFDVVCESDGSIKQSGHAGNNRLKVMFDIRMSGYKSSDRDGKRKVAREIVSSIIDDTKSRFLQKDLTTGMYRTLDREVAFDFIENSLSSASGVHQQLRASAVRRLMDRKHKKELLDRIEHRKSLESLDSNDPPPTTFTSLKRSSVTSQDSTTAMKRRSTSSQESTYEFKRPSILSNGPAPPAMKSPDTPDMKQNKCTAHAA